MELIWAFSKLLEYLVVVPTWGLAMWLAALFYPREGDPMQDMLAFIFMVFIIVGIGFGLNYALNDHPSAPQTTAKAPDKPKDKKEGEYTDSDIAAMKTELSILESFKNNGGLTATPPASPTR